MTDTIWLVGCGNMGGAMLRQWVGAGRYPASITVIDPGAPTVPHGVRIVAEPPEARPDIIVLAVKPQQLGDVSAMLAGVRPKLLLSILAGVEIATLAERLPAAAIVRAMPNLPVSIGQGVVALNGDVDVATGALAESLVAQLGLVEWISDESLFDAVTALSGCGPGYVFRFIEALARAGTALGLPADQAARLALATVQGSAMLADRSDESPAVLADRVASPGGSTREGLNVLDKDGAINRLLLETLQAAEARNRELAAAAR